jgi:hypothetical protein
MGHPASFRLPEELLARIDEEASERGTTATALVTTLLDEGLKTRRFPGIIYRDGLAGRRAAVLGGPGVWEIVRAIKSAPGRGEQRLRRLAVELGLPRSMVAAALEFYTAFPAEIDARIAADERASRRLRRMIERRERLLSR